MSKHQETSGAKSGLLPEMKSLLSSTEFMKRFLLLHLTLIALICQSGALQAEELPRVKVLTTMGLMEIELDVEKAPRTVKNFLKYVEDHYYDGLIFHRVISGWLIQGGGYDEQLNYFKTYDPIRSEARNGLKNVRGTIAMARHWDPNSADSQFFINLSDNDSFNHKNRTVKGFGYCVFGRVVKGMDIADAIGAVETGAKAHLEKDVPIEPVYIVKMELIK